MQLSPDLNNHLTGPLWQAAAQGKLKIPYCTYCRTHVWYPVHACPDCGMQTTWHDISGRGSVFSFTVIRRPLFYAFAEWTPFISVLITPEEAPHIRLVSQLVDCSPEDVCCDMPVEVCFRELSLPDSPVFTAPLFKPR